MACSSSSATAIQTLAAPPVAPVLVVAEPSLVPADRHPVGCYVASLGSPASRATALHALESIARLLTSGSHDARTLPWHELRRQHVGFLRAQLAQHRYTRGEGELRGYSPSSINKHLCALRGVLRECWRLGLVAAEDYQRAVDFEGVRGVRVRPGRAVPTGEVLALFQACAQRKGPAGERDSALLAVLFGCGLRRAEVVALDVASYARVSPLDPEQGVLRVLGKGNREREQPVPREVRAALDAWLAVRGDAAGPLFCPVDKAGKVTVRRVTTQAVYLAVGRAAKRAGVPAFAPHDARRTFVSDLLDAGADLAATSKLAGHASPNVTARYDLRGDRIKAKAATLVRLPYVRRMQP